MHVLCRLWSSHWGPPLSDTVKTRFWMPIVGSSLTSLMKIFQNVSRLFASFRSRSRFSAGPSVLGMPEESQQNEAERKDFFLSASLEMSASICKKVRQGLGWVLPNTQLRSSGDKEEEKKSQPLLRWPAWCPQQVKLCLEWADGEKEDVRKTKESTDTRVSRMMRRKNVKIGRHGRVMKIIFRTMSSQPHWGCKIRKNKLTIFGGMSLDRSASLVAYVAQLHSTDGLQMCIHRAEQDHLVQHKVKTEVLADHSLYTTYSLASQSVCRNAIPVWEHSVTIGTHQGWYWLGVKIEKGAP